MRRQHLTAPRRRPRPQGQGLTLIEVVIATGILSIFVLGMFSALTSAQRADVLTREHAAASEACFSMLDAVLGGAVPDSSGAVEVPFAVDVKTTAGARPLVPASPYPDDPWTFLGRTAPTTVSQPGIAVARIVEGEDLMEVRVTVAWRAADNTNQRLEVVSRRLR